MPEEAQDKAEEMLADLRIKRYDMTEALSKLDLETREILLELLAEFDRRYSDLAEADRGHYTTYFATVSCRACRCTAALQHSIDSCLRHQAQLSLSAKTSAVMCSLLLSHM